MDPTREEVFAFLQEFLGEVAEVFPDKYVHLGGDEVSLDCWKSNPFIGEVMQSWGLVDYSKLQSYFIVRNLHIVRNLSKKSIGTLQVPIIAMNVCRTSNVDTLMAFGYSVWQEVFDNGDPIYEDTIVDVWKNFGNGWRNELELVNIIALNPFMLSASLRIPDSE